MGLESGTFISDLNIANPASGDPKNQGDDHLRLIKSTLKTTFPNVTGAVTVTHSDINSVTGKAPLASPSLTGTPTAPTAAAGTNTTQLATTAHVFAERTNTATLTNKTLTAPVISSPIGLVKADVGLSNVDNTSDLNKPISTATQAALNLKADLNSPVLTGTPSAPTASTGTNTTQIATTAYVQSSIMASSGITASLPSQSGNAGEYLFTNGTVASWEPVFPSQSGNAGKTLTTNGSVVSWTNSPNHLSDVAKYDATVTVGSSLGASIADVRSVQLTSSTELVLFLGASSLHGAVWDNTNKTFGSPALIRTATFASTDMAAVGVSSSSVLLATLPAGGTALEAVVLSVTGTTITVNSASTSTLAQASTFVPGYPGRLLQVGSSYVLAYYGTATVTTGRLRAITVSGTTATIGSEVSFTNTGAAFGTNNTSANLAYSSTEYLSLSASTTVLYAQPATVSGTTITLGTQATTTTNNATLYSAAMLSSGRAAVVYRNANVSGAVISISSNVASMSTVTLVTTAAAASGQVIGAQMLVTAAATNGINVLTDNAGTAVAGTALSSSAAGTTTILSAVGSNVVIQDGADFAVQTYTVSGNNPSLVSVSSGILDSGGSSVVGLATSFNANTSAYANLVNGTNLILGSKSVGFSSRSWLQVAFDGSGLVLQQVPAIAGTARRSALGLNALVVHAFNSLVPTRVLVRRLELT